MVSVVIPAYNEEKLIASCLEALTKQKTNHPYEVIVVDNNSTDNTRKVIKTFEGRLNLKVIVEKTKGRGAARATGFKNATGKFILSTDADAIVPPDWIEKLISKLNNDNIAVSGTLRVNDVGRFKNFMINQLHIPLMVLFRALFGHHWLSGFSFAITKELYEKAGGFNPKINTQEDVDLTFKIKRYGKIKLITDAPVNLSGRRYKNGIVVGLLPYAQTFVSYFWLKKEKIELSDIR